MNIIFLRKIFNKFRTLIFLYRGYLIKITQKKEFIAHNIMPISYRVDVDEDYDEKVQKIIQIKKNFGDFDFADIATWIFASSLSNHRIVHQRIDEGAALWRAVKATTGPILEVGRAAGGSTLILLAASSNRQVISIDRGPFHAWCSDLVFNREDVKNRLKLYIQSSRAKIQETEFGLIFIDADHSYEGVCHDIATFWNSLKTIDGVRPLMAFHDGAANPITYVEPVHRACEELLSDPSIARKVESWGSMLIIEKISDLNQDEWYRKQHREFWAQFNYDSFTVYDPKNLISSLTLESVGTSSNTENISSGENFDSDRWNTCNLEQEKLPLNVDNPVRLFRESSVIGEHKIYNDIMLLNGKIIFTIFIRPLGIDIVYISLSQDHKTTLYVEFNLNSNEILNHRNENAFVDLLAVESIFQSGYFRISITFSQNCSAECVRFSIGCKNNLHEISYLGNKRRGIFFNLATLSYISG